MSLDEGGDGGGAEDVAESERDMRPPVVMMSEVVVF